MPIVGLTDRAAEFPQIGSVRLGAPKPENGNRPGADLKHFRVEFDESETESLAAFTNAYGTKPVELNVLLPFNEIERNFDAYYEAYVAGGLVYRSDGETVLYEIDPKTGTKLVTNGEPRKPHRANVPGMKATGRLKVIVPELGRAAFLVVHTTSVHNIANLSKQLAALQYINGGRLAGIPLKLRRRPVKISTPTPDGKRARREKWLLSIEADPTWVQRSLSAMQQAALPQLTAPEVIEAETLDDEWEEEVFEAGEPEPPTDAERWALFVEQAGVNKMHIAAALGTERVSEWLAEDDARTLDDAIGLVEQQLEGEAA